MPLPPALAARLAKRGIIKSTTESEVEEEEEVIAEDYDDQENKVEANDNDIGVEEDHNGNEHVQDDITEPVIGCPNKWNVYHICSLYCKEKWGSGKPHPSPRTERKRLRMLKKYPLSEGWEEIYDPGTGRHYYWNKLTGEVSWLPPGHPRCKISLPANKLRALVRDTLIQDAEDEEHEASESEEEEDDEDEENEEMETDQVDLEDDRNIRRNKDRLHDRSRGRTKVRENDLDPMDPAAYSEAPRGTWSTGLDRKGEAKTGADTTASGPLYQMRPYPSPGAVLRMNAEIKSRGTTKSDDEDKIDE